MHMEPLVIGAASFAIIGLFHPIVIKAEYYWTYRVWPVFLIVGCVLLGLSLLIYVSVVVNSIVTILAFTCFWSILEVYHQRDRVEKGWFPENPKRKKKDRD